MSFIPKSIHIYIFAALALLSATLISGTILSSPLTSATEPQAAAHISASVNVALACTMNGTVTDPHTATIPNGTSNSSIGETTLKAFCNDADGFAIYAVGYTDNEYGKTVLTNPTIGTNHDIVTGTAIGPVGNVDTSNWAMKLTPTTNPNPTYPITIENSFSSFHEVPSIFTMVAQRSSGTDINPAGQQTAEGSTLTTTYQAYINKTQPAGTYTGKVKYTLIHPSTAPEPVGDNEIGVVFNGNGLYFDQAGTRSTNKVLYERQCEDEYGYIANTPTIMKTRNLSADGTQNGPYSEQGGTWYDGDGTDPSYVEFEGASKVKIVIKYGLSNDVGYFNLSVDGTTISSDTEFGDNYIDRSGTETIVSEGSSVSIYSEVGSMATNPGYDYGVYAKVYPIYDEPTEGATYGLVQNVCSYHPTIGTYSDIAEGGIGMWYTKLNDNVFEFYSEEDVLSFLGSHSEELKGISIVINASNTYTIVFDANGGSGTMADQVVYQYQHTQINESTFTKPHQEVISWNTEPDGTGKKIYASMDTRDEDRITDSLTDAGETIRLYAQWGNCKRDYICYDDNGANSLATTTATKLYGNPVTLSASNFRRSSYGFAGWNTEPDGTGKYYGPNENYAYSYGEYTAEGARLYAIWVPSAGNLQNWPGCSNLDLENVTALTDSRDGNTYTVAKLADGNCWIVENLRLGSSSPIVLTTADTQSAGTLPAVVDSFGSSNNGQYVSDRNSNPPTAAKDTKYLYGNYYSWAAAINASVDPPSGVVNTSICPAGWKLPYQANVNGSFDKLISSLGGEDNRGLVEYPYNFVYAGELKSLSNNFGQSQGRYWTSSGVNNNSENYAFYLSLSRNTSFVNYYTYNTNAHQVKSSGHSVRCVLVLPD